LTTNDKAKAVPMAAIDPSRADRNNEAGLPIEEEDDGVAGVNYCDSFSMQSLFG